MGEGRRRRRHGQAVAMDCISGLPDELLHEILLRLESARAAARTSVLSRRWRHVWAHLPKLIFDGNGTDDSDSTASPASFLDSIDGALRAYSAPTVEALDISLPNRSCPAIPARRVRSWLRFASRRLVRTLYLDVPYLDTLEARREKELVLPTMDRAQEISLSLGDRWRLGIRPAGVFMALTNLEIRCATMEGRVLEALVCSQCPCLIDLNLIVTLAAKSDVSLRSDSLQVLCFNVENSRRLEIVAPRLEELSVNYSDAVEAHISAPKLAELAWDACDCDPRLRGEYASRHLRVLEVGKISAPLMQQLDEVDELRLDFYIAKEIEVYESFVNDTTNKLPKCGTLSVRLNGNCHGFAASMLHLLKKCNSVRNFIVQQSPMENRSCPLPCPCRLSKSCKADDITLDSLEVVEIDLNNGSPEVVEFVKQLSQCNAAVLKKVVIHYYNESVNERFFAKVRDVCRPNIEVEFIVYGSDEGCIRICLD